MLLVLLIFPLLGLIVLMPRALGFGAFNRYMNLPSEVRLILEKTAAFYEYAVFLSLAYLGLSCAIALNSISNHTILSLDIIYIISTLILVMFHILKEPQSPLYNN